MAVLTVTDILLSGVAFTLTAAGAGGDSFVNDSSERTFFAVTNGGGGSINVTIAKQGSSVPVPGYGALPLADEVIAVGAGVTRIIGPFPAAKFNDANGRVNVSYSGVSSVTVNPFRLARAAG